jgi:Zn-dependent peptidase ImmA (M78 family)
LTDLGYTAKLYAGTDRRSAAEQAEQVADYFAGCVLLPRLLKRAWGNGVQTPHKLALAFGVSARAADVRLAQVGLSERRNRCRQVVTPGRMWPRLQRSAA